MIKYSRNTKTISGKLHDELVMMDPDRGKYFALNPVATRIWDILDQPREIRQICSVLITEYEVSEDQCIREVSEYIDEMIRLGLVLSQEVNDTTVAPGFQ